MQFDESAIYHLISGAYTRKFTICRMYAIYFLKKIINVAFGRVKNNELLIFTEIQGGDFRRHSIVAVLPDSIDLPEFP